MKHLLRNRKGMTMAEVIVAFAVVLIVTASAISLMISSAQTDVAYRDQYRALIGCENAEECIRFADGNEEILESTLGFVGFQKEGDAYVLACGDHRVTVTLEYENYVVRYNDDVIYEYVKPNEE